MSNNQECLIDATRSYKYSYVAYVNWAKNLGNSSLQNCMNCKYSHVSQYQNQFKLQETIDRRNKRIARQGNTGAMIL